MLAYIDYLIFRFQYFLKHRRGRPEHELAIRRLYGARRPEADQEREAL